MAHASTIPALRSVYKDYFDIGAAVNLTTIETQKNVLTTHYNSLTAENDMKFERVHPSEGVYTFEAADKIADFAAANGMKLRGHTLVWHNQTPDWIFESASGGPVDRDTLLARMKSHIDTVVSRYKGIIYGWDVVNEVIEDKSDVWLRESKWLNLAGEDFIAKAFEYAHEADPKALLFYNDYNECNPEKRDKIIRLVQSMQDKDVPIHGIGMQGHWNLNGPSLAEIREAIERYAALGLKLQVTELDISVFDYEDRRTDLTEPTAEMLERQAERYEQVFGLFREYKEVLTAVTFWGAADDYTWLDNFPVRGRKNWPFVLDAKHEPKASFLKIANWQT
ncbi:endo-1,4-beta-xylanase [Paenibacillus glycanilyticus]|uniref:endo-1,4-beta-xylanase n=1 Tax=Paenibacillus glycanilyticus TaxID=126569 RepID=UPI002041D0FF|nr:endo-1,4-beta-xylanase [Paenibacillus glycanilyticus]MCM3628898.1 endo-1,4-beta-xylanase [Paenibacillus glycanilyticus]